MDDYLEKILKVILIKEVKGRGKRGDIIDCNLVCQSLDSQRSSGHRIRRKPEDFGTRKANRNQSQHLQEIKELKSESDPNQNQCQVGAKTSVPFPYNSL